MIYSYPQEVHDFVKAHCEGRRDRELAEMCNKELGTSFTARTMKCFRHNHGYQNHMSTGLSHEEYWQNQTKWPKGMYEYIRDNSWNVSSAEMAERVNAKFGTSFTVRSMKSFRQRHGIKSGVTGWYQKGHPPGTKGKTLEEICKGDPDKLARVRATQYSKGHRPQNELPLGTITKTSDGYVIRKKAMKGKFADRWEFMHIVTWEEHNGPVPEGYIVMFLDNNKENYDISNLICVPRAIIGAMAKKGYYQIKDPELKAAAYKVTELKVKSNRIKRRGKQT